MRQESFRSLEDIRRKTAHNSTFELGGSLLFVTICSFLDNCSQSFFDGPRNFARATDVILEERDRRLDLPCVLKLSRLTRAPCS
jgi:hypothetical protein